MIYFVKFSSFVLVMVSLTACSSAQWVSFEGAKLQNLNSTVTGQITKPEGPGPFPAVLLLHGCNGQLDRDLIDWPKRLERWGYVTLAVDSFGTRDVSSNCGWYNIGSDQLEADAHGALEYLSAQPFVDSGNLAAIGFSMGATTVLELAQRERWIDTKSKLKFKAGVAMYPRCRRLLHLDFTLVAPVEIIIGELDDWTPVYECQNLIKGVSTEGATLRLNVLPGAYHSFDVFIVDGRTVGQRVFQGHHLEPNENAHTQALSIIRQFLAKNLAKQPS